jgi:radical SAM superfamily enzyme YgiQ (UPF0313 family)
MRKLKIGILDLVTKGSVRSLWARTMHANLASIMPQVIATWCEEEGHTITYICYTGLENLIEELPETLDLVIIGTFSQGAQLAYAVSNFCRSKGAITALGGPHARCYPQDAQKYFDYVLGFTDRSVIRDLLQDCSPHRPIGVYLSANGQPATLPGVQERWKFIELNHRKALWIKGIPMIGSMGCPYTCSFCIDSVIPYQPLEFDLIKADLRFLLGKFKRPIVGWHDPNFGIRFDDYLSAIEDAVPPGSIDFLAESSLSLLSEPHVKRLKRNGFKALLPGIESWQDFGNKSKTGKHQGIDKVQQVSEQVNMIRRYVPYVQTNFVFGLDIDEGPEPFELTKRFLDETPGIYPVYSLLTAYGQAAPLNLEYQRSGRVLPFPFYFLDNKRGMNVKPKNYAWDEFYDNVIDLAEYNISWGNLFRSYKAIDAFIPRWVNVIRVLTWFEELKYYREVRRRFDEDPQFRPFFEGKTTEIPEFYVERIRKSLGTLWEWLPEGALDHDPNAYLEAQENSLTQLDDSSLQA